MTTAIDTQPEILPGLLTEDDARKMAGAIRRGRDNLRALCIEFEQREGWRVLSYKSMRACAEAEFGWSWRQFYRQLAAAEIEGQVGMSIGQMPESHARELARLPAPERAEVYEAVKAATDGKTTAADVREAVERRRTPEPAPLPDLAGVECFTEEAIHEECDEGEHRAGEARQRMSVREAAGQEEPWPPGQEFCIHGRDLINATCEECAEEAERAERAEQIPGLDAKNAQNAILGPSSTPPPPHVPARGAHAPQRQAAAAERGELPGDTPGESLLGEIDLAWLRDNDLTVGTAMNVVRLVVAAATGESGGQARRRMFGAVLRQARGQK